MHSFCSPNHVLRLLGVVFALQALILLLKLKICAYYYYQGKNSRNLIFIQISNEKVIKFVLQTDEEIKNLHFSTFKYILLLHYFRRNKVVHFCMLQAITIPVQNKESMHENSDAFGR